MNETKITITVNQSQVEHLHAALIDYIAKVSALISGLSAVNLYAGDAEELLYNLREVSAMLADKMVDD